MKVKPLELHTFSISKFWWWQKDYFYLTSFPYRPHRTFKNAICFMAVSRIKQLDFGLQKWSTFEIKSNLAARAFKVRYFFLTVKRISYFFDFQCFMMSIDAKVDERLTSCLQNYRKCNLLLKRPLWNVGQYCYLMGKSFGFTSFWPPSNSIKFPMHRESEKRFFGPKFLEVCSWNEFPGTWIP